MNDRDQQLTFTSFMTETLLSWSLWYLGAVVILHSLLMKTTKLRLAVFVWVDRAVLLF